MSQSIPTVTLDVRPLLAAGEEPFSEIRRAVDALPPAAALIVIAPFMPAPLIEKLRAEGFAARVERLPDGGWSTHFQRG